MRLLSKTIQEVWLYRKSEVESDYIGRECEISDIGSFFAHVEPLNEVCTKKEYGIDTDKSVELFCDTDTDIRLGDLIKLPKEGKFRITSITRFRRHLVAKAVLEKNYD